VVDGEPGGGVAGCGGRGGEGSEEGKGVQVDWKSADEVAEDIMNGEATYQLIVDLWSRVGELEKEVAESS
jgi:hypothetical protein